MKKKKNFILLDYEKIEKLLNLVVEIWSHASNWIKWLEIKVTAKAIKTFLF